jgi:VWFA-related protein
MNKLTVSLAVLIILTFSTVCFSQSPTPTPTPTPEESSDTDVVKISTNLIQVDVTVTDKKGNQVTDLKPEDFEILENGKKQEITNFSYIALAPENSNPESTTKKPNSNKNLIPTPPTKLKPEQVRRTYALVVDDLGLSFAGSYWVKQALKKFVSEQMQEGDMVAILRVSGGIGALQSFTSDKRQLLAAVDRIRWNGLSRVGVNSYEPIRIGGSIKMAEGIEQNKEFEQANALAYQSNFAVGTLGALSYVIRGMRELPGRKSLMLFSEGFQLLDRSKPGAPQSTRMKEALKSVAELANRSSVVIYTLDPRGLTIPGYVMQAQDDMNVLGAAEALKMRGANLIDSQNSLRYLAEETGGIPFVERNDWDSGIQKALEDQKGYYLIGYQPDSETFDPKKSKFNKLKINLKRNDLKIRYRSGFFGITDETIKQMPQTPQQKLSAALTSPFGASDVNLNLYSIFYNDSQNKNFIRAFVYIDTKDLTFTLNPKGLYETKFSSIAMIFDSNGASADNDIHPTILEFTKEQLSKAREKGIIYNLSVPILKTGAYQLRVALQDLATGKIGSASQFIEVPNLEKKNLTLSNLIVKNYSPAEWKKVSLDQHNDTKTPENSVLFDTTSRQFKRGSYLTYSFVIYNAVTNAVQKPQLQLQARLFRDGKMLMESSPSPVNVAGQQDLQRIQALDAVTLGTDLEPGDYALQIVILDSLAKEKNKVATQWIDFEIIK